MYVQVVTYSLGMSESEYLDIANELAPTFARMPGMAAKIWLEDLDLGRYGAVYFWDDRESMERFLGSDLFEGTNADFVDVESEGFGILENLTSETQPVLELVEPRRAGLRRAGAAGADTKAVRRKASTAAAAQKKAPAKQAPAKNAVTKKAPAKNTVAKKSPPKKTAG